MKNKKKFIIILSVIFFIIVIFIFCYFYMVKNLKTRNNKSSQEIVNSILNLKTYDAIIEVTVKSNKNQNKYIIKQNYKNENENYQEVLEPENIKGVKIIKADGKLKLENTKLNLVSVFENYNYLSENDLDLECFIKDYKESNQSKYEEKEEEIIMETYSKNNSNIKKDMYISKETEKPEKIEISDTNKKTAVYILYKEINLNRN